MSSQSISRLVESAKKLQSDRARALLSLGMVFGLGAVGTLAYWTDTATVTSGNFISGKLDMALDGANQGNPNAYAKSTFNANNLKPGDSVAALLTVDNIGTIPFKFTATGTATGDLAQYLKFEVVAGGAIDPTNSNACTPNIGTSLGQLTLGANATPVIAAAQDVVVGAAKTVCVVASLPMGFSADNNAQNKSATATLVFNAKQFGA